MFDGLISAVLHKLTGKPGEFPALQIICPAELHRLGLDGRVTVPGLSAAGCVCSGPGPVGCGAVSVCAGAVCAPGGASGAVGAVCTLPVGRGVGLLPPGGPLSGGNTAQTTAAAASIRIGMTHRQTF